MSIDTEYSGLLEQLYVLVSLHFRDIIISSAHVTASEVILQFGYDSWNGSLPASAAPVGHGFNNT